MWEKQKEWHGNPSLGYECWMKKFPRPAGTLVPVFLWGKEGIGKNKPCRDYDGNITHYQDFPDWTFTVSAGANSDYSYTGGFYPDCPTLQEAMDIIDEKAKNKQLIK